jgi:MinD-like ATPase involved in chromosome partitioning or flagellar assembly
MAHIYTVLSGKGGVGKSTLCANVAVSLSQQGKKVLLIDGDVSLRSLDMLLGLDEMVVYDWSDVLSERCDKNKARLFFDENLQLLASPLELPENFDYDAFFRAFAKVWAGINTTQLEYQALTQDSHPLHFLRTNVTLQQFDEFYETYGVQEGDTMYLAPEDRILVW